MREIFKSGSVGRAPGNRCPYLESAAKGRGRCKSDLGGMGQISFAERPYESDGRIHYDKLSNAKNPLQIMG